MCNMPYAHTMVVFVHYTLASSELARPAPWTHTPGRRGQPWATQYYVRKLSIYSIYTLQR